MAKKDKERMKRGLSSLFEDNGAEEAEAPAGAEEEKKETETESSADSAENEKGGRLMSMRLSLIEPDRNQPRKTFDEQALSELADNISQVGILQPLLVRPGKVVGRYTIVAGERRWRAARLAGLTEVPVIIKDMTPSQAAQVALIENLQREDLSPVEEAKAFKRLKSTFNMTQENIAAAVGKSRSAIANSLRLLELEPECLEALEKGLITVGHAKALLSMTDRDGQLILLERTLNEGLTVRDLEKLAAKQPGTDLTPQERARTVKPPDDHDKVLQEYRLSMKETFGVDALFKRTSGGKLSMKVSFGDERELKDFLKRLIDK